MSKKVVAVLFGGQSSEHDISRISAVTVISNIPRDKYYVMPVYITRDGRWMLYDGPVENLSGGQWEKYAMRALLSPDAEHGGLLRIVGDKVKNIHIDIAFPVLHGRFGEDGSVQGLLELARIPYVGCGILSSALSMNKAFTKIIAEKAGLEQAEYEVVRRTELKDEQARQEIIESIEGRLGYPCYVKPANAGSSVGITRAVNRESLEAGLDLAAENDKTIVVEREVKGRELECAVLGNENPKASGVGEIIAGAEFYDFDAKYNSKESKTIVPADLDGELSEEIKRRAVKIYKALECSGLARVDFFVEDENNRIIFNEINTMPGFTSISMYAMLWDAAGIGIEQLVDTLIELALKREYD